MNLRLRRRVTALVIGTVATAGSALGAPFDLPQSVIAGGGGTGSGGTYSLMGTIGQEVAFTSNGGAFELSSGFWTGTGDVGTAPALQRAVSRKTHGVAGGFDLDLGVVAPIPAADPQQTPASR